MIEGMLTEYTEVPSNAILNMFERPSLFMGGIVTAWGIVMTCHGFVHNFQELCGVRILLGLFEYVLESRVAMP
jgi:hypothetical protein